MPFLSLRSTMLPISSGAPFRSAVASMRRTSFNPPFMAKPPHHADRLHFLDGSGSAGEVRNELPGDRRIGRADDGARYVITAVRGVDLFQLIRTVRRDRR